MDRELATEEARLWHGEVIEWSAALDRTLPTARRHANAYGVRFTNPHTSETTIMLGLAALGLFRRKHGLIVDDGTTAAPFYAIGRGRSRSGKVFTRRYVPFPMNTGGRKLTDSGEEFDSTVWLLGPHVYHHIKIQVIDEFGRKPTIILPPDRKTRRTTTND
jgi:hypothetical protein